MHEALDTVLAGVDNWSRIMYAFDVAHNLVPYRAWNLILVESGRPILLSHLAGNCLAVGIDYIRTTVLVRHIAEAHLLSIFREDIYLVAPVRSVAIQFMLLDGMLTVSMTKAFLTEVLVAIVLIYIAKKPAKSLIHA